MLMSNKYYNNDIKMIFDNNTIDWSAFKGKSFLITGGTGLIGTLLVNSLLYADNKLNLNININLLVRNYNKASILFGDSINQINIIDSSVENCNNLDLDFDIDYIIHAASQTSSKGFIDKPVETVKTTLLGTMNLLDTAKRYKVKKFIFLSTMEVYGVHQSDDKLVEENGLCVTPYDVRNCYPISKIAAENLCCDYANEFGLDVSVLRLTQTFGPGVDYNDNRVFAEFIRCVIEGRDIVLKTKGETKRSYLYTADAVTAIFTILQNMSNTFQIYNVANEETYCSVYEMALLIAVQCANNSIDVRIEEQDICKFGYAPTLHMNLDTKKIQSLGWKPKVDLKTMYNNLCSYYKENI